MSITGMEAAIWVGSTNASGRQHSRRINYQNSAQQCKRICPHQQGGGGGHFSRTAGRIGSTPAAPRGIASMGVSKSVKSGPSIDLRRERVEQGLGLPQVERTFCQEAGHQRHLICSYFHHTGEELFYRGFQIGGL